jgi:hypothetical protein
MARVKVISPSGEAGDIPEEQLAAAMAQGYKKADAGPAAQPAAVEPEASEPASGDADSDDMLTATLKQIPGFLGGIVKGAAKGVGNMITGAGDMAGHLPATS